MVSVGSHYCVAELMGVQLSGFFAMMMKHLVNMHYLWGVGGLRLIWTYLRHEFFHMEDRRSLLADIYPLEHKPYGLYLSEYM